jgi:hypothetical protein
MANLYYTKEFENKCRLYYTEKIVIKEGKIQSDVYLDIDIVNKEVQKIHDFFHKILVSKILNDAYSMLEINNENVKDEPFFKEESFIKLNAFLLEIITELNNKLESISKKVVVS